MSWGPVKKKKKKKKYLNVRYSNPSEMFESQLFRSRYYFLQMPEKPQNSDASSGPSVGKWDKEPPCIELDDDDEPRSRFDSDSKKFNANTSKIVNNANYACSSSSSVVFINNSAQNPGSDDSIKANGSSSSVIFINNAVQNPGNDNAVNAKVSSSSVVLISNAETPVSNDAMNANVSSSSVVFISEAAQKPGSGYSVNAIGSSKFAETACGIKKVKRCPSPDSSCGMLARPTFIPTVMLQI